MNKYAPVMAKRSTAELLEITRAQKGDYETEAIEAAETELARRNPNAGDIELAQEEIEARRQEKERMGKIQRLENGANRLLQALRPQPGKVHEWVIRFIAVVLGVIYIIGLKEQWSFYSSFFDPAFGTRPWKTIDYILVSELFLNDVMLPFVAFVGLWTFRKFGWLIFTGLLVYDFVETVVGLVTTIYGAIYAEQMVIGKQETFLEMLFRRHFFYGFIVRFLLIAGLFIYMLSRPVRAKFGAGSTAIITSIGTAILVMVLIFFIAFIGVPGL